MHLRPHLMMLAYFYLKRVKLLSYVQYGLINLNTSFCWSLGLLYFYYWSYSVLIHGSILGPLKRSLETINLRLTVFVFAKFEALLMNLMLSNLSILTFYVHRMVKINLFQNKSK